MAQRCFKIKAIFFGGGGGVIYRHYILIPYLDSTDVTSRKYEWYIMERLLN